jgi:bifunctional non-homologous end joining protein LigD
MKFTPTHTDKVLWPEYGYTKGDMLGYYEKAAKYILPYLKDRPVVLKRYPHGIDGESFFQKNVEGEVPSFVKRVSIPAETIKKDVHYVVCNTVETLLYLANLGTIELHPWNSRLRKLHYPDFMIFDLDPGAGTTYDTVVDAALKIKELLDEDRIECLVKTSGKRGLHVYAPLAAKYEYDQARAYTRSISEKMASLYPKLATSKRGEEHRHGKIFIDYLRNSVGQTAVAPYSLRAVPEATVSTPLEWSELKKGLTAEKFTIKTIFKRLEAKGDLWFPLMGKGSKLPR